MGAYTAQRALDNRNTDEVTNRMGDELARHVYGYQNGVPIPQTVLDKAGLAEVRNEDGKIIMTKKDGKTAFIDTSMPSWQKKVTSLQRLGLETERIRQRDDKADQRDLSNFIMLQNLTGDLGDISAMEPARKIEQRAKWKTAMQLHGYAKTGTQKAYKNDVSTGRPMIDPNTQQPIVENVAIFKSPAGPDIYVKEEPWLSR